MQNEQAGLKRLVEIGKSMGFDDLRGEMLMPDPFAVAEVAGSAGTLISEINAELGQEVMSQQIDLAFALTEVEDDDPDVKALGSIIAVQHVLLALFVAARELAQEARKMLDVNQRLMAEVESQHSAPVHASGSPLPAPPPDMPGGASLN